MKSFLSCLRSAENGHVDVLYQAPFWSECSVFVHLFLQSINYIHPCGRIKG